MENQNNNFQIRKFYATVFLISFALAVGTYVFFATEKPIYAARGKFSYYLSPTSNPTNNMPVVSEPITRSIADSVQTRVFLANLYKKASIKLNDKISDNPTKYIRTNVIQNSSVIQVNVFSEDTDNLARISQNFYSVLEESSIIAGTNPSPKINIVEPLYIDAEPAYPKPLEYAGLVLIGSILVGIMFLYVFSNEN